MPETEIVVLTMEESPLFAQQALEAGAVGFVLKDRADSELLGGDPRRRAGEEYISPRVAAGVDALRRAVNGDGLSPRETEVLRLIALGHTSAEIAPQAPALPAYRGNPPRPDPSQARPGNPCASWSSSRYDAA